jgi:hypothetical protein
MFAQQFGSHAHHSSNRLPEAIYPTKGTPLRSTISLHPVPQKKVSSPKRQPQSPSRDEMGYDLARSKFEINFLEPTSQWAIDEIGSNVCLQTAQRHMDEPIEGPFRG